MTAAATEPRVSLREAGIVLSVALLFRVAYLLLFAKSPFFDAPILDSAYHDALARAIAAGDPTAGAPYFRPPLFPWTLGGLYSLFGAGPWPGRVLDAGLGVATVLAVLAVGVRVGLSRAGRVGAALAAALYAPQIFLEGELLGEPLAAALGAWGLYALLRAGAAPERNRYRWWAAMSLLWSLAALARGPLALLAVAGALFACFTPGPRVRRTALTLAVTLAVWAGPAAIMASHGAGFRFPATQAGINLYAGNHSGADGRGVDIPGLPAGGGWREFAGASVRLAESRAHRPLDAPAASDAWTREAVRFWSAHPGEALSLTARKALYLIHGFETPNNRSLYLAREDIPWFSAILWKIPGFYWPTGLLIPLAMVGLAQLRDRRWHPVLAYFGVVLVPLLLFFVCARFRAPAMPALVLLAAAGAMRLAARRPTAWIVFLAAYAAANIPWAHAVAEDPPRDRLVRAESLFNAGRSTEAEREYARVLALDPNEGRAHLGLAALAERRGDLDVARREVEIAGASIPDSWSVQWAWARILDRQGHPEAAIPHLEAAVRAYPENPEILGALGLTLEAVGRDGLAAEALERSAARGSRDPEVWNSVGRYRRLAGEAAGALGAWDRAIDLDPRHFKALYNRGLARAESGERDAALRDLAAAQAAAPDAAAAAKARQAAQITRSRLP